MDSEERSIGRADLLVAAVVLCAIGLMIVPVPAWLLDMLLSINLGAAVFLVIASLHIGSPTRLSSFPTVLLISTLFRLALNVSSTRLILADASAGRVIDAFGAVVAQNNLLVGAVVFAILTVVQFVVISKGAERVSEVAARFALDAMPGRQLAIDADLRAGSIDAAQAQLRRQRLQKESQMYGAMDGAMKFVKGDAIAALVIVSINLFAGAAVGVLQMDMSLGQAVATYLVLTIGDGVVSEIPALLVATSAAIVVTRVSSLAHPSTVAAQIATQFLDQAAAWVGAGALLVCLAVVPGLPWLPFGLAGVAALGLGWQVSRNDPRRDEPATETQIALEIGDEAYRRLGRRGRARLRSLARSTREDVFRELGVRVPSEEVVLLPGGGMTYTISLGGVPVARGELEPDNMVSPLLAALGGVVREHAAEFMDMRATRELLLTVDAGLVEVVVRRLGMVQLTTILARLVEEGISVAPVAKIMGVLAENDTVEGTMWLVESVREGLSRYISYKYGGNQRLLTPYVVGREIEEMVSGSRRGGHLAMPESVRREIVDAARAAVRGDEMAPLFLTSQTVRPHFRALLSREFGRVVVLSHQEIDPALRVEPRGRVVVG